ncbi:hypothetical protein PT300_08030 [Enterobacteriaceae bacterium ESL0689]|nr:hypothetical protein [Enterobacteriaceae bacterium ESL0689]
MTTIKAVFGVVTLCLSAYATGMPYVVSNYKGHIEKYPVHMSLQYYDFGKYINVEGSYYYDNHRSPIALYGINESNSIILCEAVNDENVYKYMLRGEEYDISKCPFRLTRNTSGLSGEWRNERSVLQVNLKEMVRLSDDVVTGASEELDIPFWGQTKRHSFIGIYEMGIKGIVINKVNVVDKKNGEIIQVINPQLNNCNFGFYMTTIFQNIEKDGSQISLNCYSIRPEVSVNYRFNKKNSRYNIVNK